MSKRLAITAVLPHRALVSVPRLPALLLALCGGFGIAQAATLSGFESGLAGWVHSGDVSIHSAAIGLVPTEGQQLAFLSNMDFRHNPYSGKPANYATRGLLGMPDDTNDFLALMPPVALGINPLAFGSAATLRFIAPGMGQLAFDWAKLGADTDFAFLSLWSDDGAYRFNDWIYAGPLPTALGGVRLCQRIFENSTPPEDCDRDFYGYNTVTGWHTETLPVPRAGAYTIGFATGSILDDGTPTILALDDVRFQALPAPATLGLSLIALTLLGLVRRRGAVPGR
jgi:hypothetical protein